MFAVVYRWRLRPSAENEFHAAWRELTLAMRDECGSLGSSLHRAAEDSLVAYARWPDRATREACSVELPTAWGAMRRSCTQRDTPLELELLDDLLLPSRPSWKERP